MYDDFQLSLCIKITWETLKIYTEVLAQILIQLV